MTLSKREIFALAALAGNLGQDVCYDAYEQAWKYTAKDIAQRAFEIADAILKEDT